MNPSSMVPDWIHPVLKRSYRDLLADVMKTKPADEPPMARVMPFPATYHASSFRSRRKLSVGIIAPTVVFVTIVRVPG